MADYWDDPALNLKVGSRDTKAHAATKTHAAVAGSTYVHDLQRDLIALGYLPPKSDDGSFGHDTERAVRHFQRHAARPYRMLKGAKVSATAWPGSATGVCDQKTAQEIRVWIDKGFQLPLGLFKIVKIPGGKLRDDVAPLWAAAIKAVDGKGGTLFPPGKPDTYSDTWRNPLHKFKSTGGNSSLSFHYCGRAVDLSWSPADGGKHRRWWLALETVGGDTFFRIFCKTDQQDGSQGTKIAAKTKKYFDFEHKKEKDLPEGYYIDLTQVLEDSGFKRIKAHSDWKTNEKGREWWHFQHADDAEPTFLDEMELIGFTEKQLLGSGRTKKQLDHAPG